MLNTRHPRPPDREINYRGRAVRILAFSLAASMILFSGLAALDVLRTGEMSDNTAGFLLPIFTGLIGLVGGYIGGRSEPNPQESEADMRITETRPDGTVTVVDTDPRPLHDEEPAETPAGAPELDPDDLDDEIGIGHDPDMRWPDEPATEDDLPDDMGGEDK